MQSESFTIKLLGTRTYSFTYPTDFLGEGSMANLYKGLSNDGQSVAIKALKPENEKSPVTLNLWKNNADFRLKHKNLMQVYEEIYQNERRHIVLEFIEGSNYETLFNTLGEKQHLTIIKQVLEGLAGLHENQYVHRDIKPSNILVDVKDGHFTKIIDYDLVMLKDTKISHFVGTEKYAPFESLQSAEIDHRCDLWAVGVILYRVFNGGKFPFLGTTKSELIQAIQSNQITHGNYSPKVQKILSKALNPSLSERYQSANEMIEDIKGLHQKKVSINPVSVFSSDGVFTLPVKIAISAVFVSLLTTLILLLN